MKKLIILDDLSNISVAENIGADLPDIISFVKDKSFSRGKLGELHINANSVNKELILDKYKNNCRLLPIYGLYSEELDSLTLSIFPSDNPMDLSIVGYAVLTKEYMKDTFKYSRVSINKMSSDREETIKEYLAKYFIYLEQAKRNNIYFVVREDNGVISNESPTIYSNNKEAIFRIAAEHLLSEEEKIEDFVLESQASNLN